MKIVVAHEGKQHSFQTAKTLQKRGLLLAYITTVYDKQGSFTHILKNFLHGNAKKKCSSRRDPEIDDSKEVQYCELKGLLLLLIQRVPGLKRLIPSYYRSLHDDFGVHVVLLWLSRSTRRAVLSIITLKFHDAGFGFGEFLLGRGKFCLQAVYLLVFPVNDTIEPPNFLGVRLLKLTQALVDQA